jgi:hypothetical protein
VHRVDFVVVGGICAVLHGAPVATFDLDVVHSHDPANIHRLLGALRALEARYRLAGRRNRAPDESHLASPGHQLLITRYGPLDLLGSIGAGRDYQALIAHTVRMRIGPRLTVRLLDLPTLIEIKQETAGEKDKAVLPILRSTLEEKRRH